MQRYNVSGIYPRQKLKNLKSGEIGEHKTAMIHISCALYLAIRKESAIFVANTTHMKINWLKLKKQAVDKSNRPEGYHRPSHRGGDYHCGYPLQMV